MDNKWGTFYGGIANESINTLSLDNQENLIIAGETNSKEGIATSGAFQSVNNDPLMVVVSLLNSRLWEIEFLEVIFLEK
jgi:hypothetical protein